MLAASTRLKREGEDQVNQGKRGITKRKINQERTRGKKVAETKIKKVYPRSSIARCIMDSPQMCMSCNQNGCTPTSMGGVALSCFMGKKRGSG
jgi:hypothetical protein